MFLGLGLGAAAIACGGSGKEGELPSPILSVSIPAQTELRQLLLRFAGATRRERAGLEGELKALRARYPSDELARVIDAHLAWIALDTDDIPRAETLSARVRSGPPGVTRDLAQVIQGAASRRRGRPAEAYTTLRPLVGKIIDDYVSRMLNWEVVNAATEAGRWEAAIDLADVWLHEAGEGERTNVSNRIAALLPRIPAEELERALRKRQAEQQEDLAESQRLLRAALAERLAAVALEKRDVRLAKELLQSSGPLLGAMGDRIAQLAGGATIARVGAPTVGLLLSVRTAEARRRGAQMAAGVSFGLGLLRSTGAPKPQTQPAQLVSRDDGALDEADRTDEALTALVGEGAAVLVTGVDRGQATAAASFARTHEIPVLLLHPPDPGAVVGPFVFVVGEEPGRVSEGLTAALGARGARPIALVDEASNLGSAARPSGVTVALSCDGSMEERTFRMASVRGLALNGDVGCAERALQATNGLRLEVAFGLEAAYAATPHAIHAVAGQFPFDADADALIEWSRVQTGVPGWWAALGRDAALLAQAGVLGLPNRETEDPGEVKARRRSVRDRLAEAKASLWTTAAPGFGGAQRLSRELQTRETTGTQR
ncbi:ABC transporter substrate-binding protein [Chondromyces crocatus]|uniref:ABC transporter substrate-binding protein n=1 Tax=Chondromyces crocatus TaxID=52 RepID=UPI00067B9F2F|nr:ABC transporter substrate-binding protein [Chondromyces crocatus]